MYTGMSLIHYRQRGQASPLLIPFKAGLLHSSVAAGYISDFVLPVRIFQQIVSTIGPAMEFNGQHLSANVTELP